MEKLTLDPGTLRVQSFAVSPEAREPAPEVLLGFTRPQICDPLTAVRC